MPRPCVCDKVPSCVLCTVWHRHPDSPAARAWRGESVAQIKAARSATAVRAEQPEPPQPKVRPTPRPSRSAQPTAAVQKRIATSKASTSPCAHRGEPTGEVDECVTCTGRIPVPILHCAKHGECFTGNYTLTGVRSCDRCGDLATNIVPGFLDPLPRPWSPPGRWNDDAAEVTRHATVARRIATGPIPEPPPMEGAGVVTCGGGKYWPGIVVMVRMLRESGSTLPVEVWYRGSCEEVTPADVAGMGVELIDADELSEARGNNRVPRGRPNLGGWESKLYALTHTRFRHVVFIDADAYFVSDPARLLALGVAHGFAAWQEGDNVRWERCGFPDGKPKGAPEGIQGGQFALDRHRCWRELLLAQWVCQHSDYYWPSGRAATTWPLFGDQDAWRLAFQLTGFRPHVIGPSEYRAGFGYVCWLDGVVAVEHRCFAKLVPTHTVGEAAALRHFADVVGAGEVPGWLTAEEQALLRRAATGVKVLEWGRYHGRSTRALAEVAAAVHSVDRLPARPARMHMERAGVKTDHVTLVEGDYTDPAANPPWAPDLVYIDGEHHAAAVRRDLVAAAALLAPGGTIAVHDFGERNAPEVAPTAVDWMTGAGWGVVGTAGHMALIRRGEGVVPTLAPPPQAQPTVRLKNGVKVEAPADGPGTELKNLLAELGLVPRAGCECEKRAAQMNAWGVEGTEANRAEVEAWLSKEAAKASWGEKVKAAVASVRAGVILNPLNPVASLVDEALRRARDKAAGAGP